MTPAQQLLLLGENPGGSRTFKTQAEYEKWKASKHGR